MRGMWRLRLFAERARAAWRLYRAQLAVRRFPMVTARRPHGLDAPLIVSLTSYPARYQTLAATLKSLLDQRMAADRTILWIAHGDRAALPAAVTRLTAAGLEIRDCDDLRSYKKLVPALAAFPGAYIVTADDDVYYPPDWLEGLVAPVRIDKRAVVAGRVHLMRCDGDGLATPYASWELATSRRAPPSADTRLFPTGVGGILYPPDAFDAEVMNRALFERLCPVGDDIWFFWMARRGGMTQVPAARPFELTTWRRSQDAALYLDNLHGDGNDVQIRAMEQHFGPVP